MMTAFVNPRRGTKEEWLQEHGTEFSPIEAKELLINKDENYIPVVLIDNYDFTSAMICDNQEVMDLVLKPADWHTKTWYKVPKSDLKHEGWV
jgi:hypothetical protein